MKQLSLMLMILVSTFVMAGRNNDLVEEPLDLEGTYTLEQVEVAIKKSLVGRDWRITDKEKGVIKATLKVRKHMVKIRIVYSKSELTIYYADSANMGYKEKGDRRLIHRKYNGWVRNLENDIKAYLY